MGNTLGNRESLSGAFRLSLDAVKRAMGNRAILSTVECANECVVGDPFMKSILEEANASLEELINRARRAHDHLALAALIDANEKILAAILHSHGRQTEL